MRGRELAFGGGRGKCGLPCGAGCLALPFQWGSWGSVRVSGWQKAWQRDRVAKPGRRVQACWLPTSRPESPWLHGLPPELLELGEEAHRYQQDVGAPFPPGGLWPLSKLSPSSYFPCGTGERQTCHLLEEASHRRHRPISPLAEHRTRPWAGPLHQSLSGAEWC